MCDIKSVVLLFNLRIMCLTLFACTESPMDYSAVSMILKFAACKPRACVDVNIVNDIRNEQDETINVTVESLHGRITLDPINGVITIIDDDGMLDF